MHTILYILVTVSLILGMGTSSRDLTPKSDVEVVDGVLPISKEGFDLIVDHETGGRYYFTKYYQRPQDPKFSSGVTIGFGYDLKFHTRKQIARDWKGVASPSEIYWMQSVSGMDGSVYHRIKNKVHITWDEAEIVFKRVTLPRWMAKTKKAYEIDSIHPHMAGALVSLTFNRGDSLKNTSRNREKIGIFNALRDKKYYLIPDLFYSMQRLWNHDRLRLRRRQEGDLAKKSLPYMK